MYDLHTHTIWSDGVLLPAELVRRYHVMGYKGIVISDHVDASNIETVLPRIIHFCDDAKHVFKDIRVVPGCEITHVPVGAITAMINKARMIGARMVIVHGETIMEPVAKGTNREAILGGADIVAHPGLIDEEDVKLAKEKNVHLEITSRYGHSFSNGHVVKVARMHGAPLTYSSDCHEPQNIVAAHYVQTVLRSAGLDEEEMKTVLRSTEDLFKSKM